MGRTLRARRDGVLEVFQGFADGVGHGDVDIIVRVIPMDGISAVFDDRRVDGDGVILQECVEDGGWRR